MKKNELYEILGVEKESTEKEIKKAYRDLSKIHHPDKGGDKEKFAKISEAYNVLSDSTKRKQYDDSGFVSNVQNNAAVLTSLVKQYYIPLVYENHNRTHVNIIGKFVEELNRLSEVIEKAINDYESKIEKLKASKDKLIFNGKENIISEMIQAEIDLFTNNVYGIKNQKNELIWCIDFMKAYEYKIVNRVGSEDLESVSTIFTSDVYNGNIFNE